mgnify:CR=1 FL=1
MYQEKQRVVFIKKSTAERQTHTLRGKKEDKREDYRCSF